MSIETKDVGNNENLTSVNLPGNDTELKVNDPSEEYQLFMDETELVRTLLGGTKAMQYADKKYLPKFPLESDAAYKIRKENSVLFNAYRKTTNFLSGQVFQKNLVFSEDVPEEFEELFEDIDKKGNEINVFTKKSFKNGISKSVSFILVDSVKVDPNEKLSKAEEKRRGIRPFLKEIRCVDVIGMIFDEDTGQLIQVRIKETIKRKFGKYGTKKVKRIRVIEPGTWELFEENAKGDFNSIEKGNFSVDYIPIHLFIPGEYGVPPLQDLADLNLHHWKSNSDQINILHQARVPLWFGKKLDSKKMVSAVGHMIISDEDDADLKVVEINGNAISAGKEDLQETEAKMALFGLSMLVQKTGNVTATEKAINSAESNSSVSEWATDFETFLQAVLETLGKYIKKDFPKNGVSVNKEFHYGLYNVEEIKVILDSIGITCSPETAFNEIQKRGFYDESLTWEDEKDEIENSNRNSSTLGNLNGTLFNNEQ